MISIFGTRIARLGTLAGLAGTLAVAGASNVMAAQPQLTPVSLVSTPVVAQHLIDLSDKPFTFVVEQQTIASGSVTIPSDGPGFLIGGSGSAKVTGMSDGRAVILGSGEASPLHAGDNYLVEPMGSVSLFEVALRTEGPEDANFVSAPQTNLAGSRELELRRGELDQQEQAVIESVAGVGLLVVLEGSVLVDRPEGSSQLLLAGEAIELDDSTAVTGIEPASVVLAVTLGEALDGSPTAAGGATVPATPGNDGPSGDTGPTVEVDSDGDGLSDADEATNNSDPQNPDSDFDGLSDGDEVHIYGSNPNSIDSDLDGLEDGVEVTQYGTDPANADTDGDGLDDLDELNYEDSDPTRYDSDGDGLNDLEEVLYGASSETDDYDGDMLTDYEEAKIYGTKPYSPDGDGDMLSDYDEVKTYGTNPAAQDGDADGLWDFNEITDFLTDPNDADTDDGYTDGLEINDGSDPLDPGDPAPVQS